MKNFKKLFAALTLTVVLAFGTNLASAGLLISDFTGGSGDPCTQPTETVDSVTGIIVLGFTGLLISDFADTNTPPVDCGIIVLG